MFVPFVSIDRRITPSSILLLEYLLSMLLAMHASFPYLAAI